MFNINSRAHRAWARLSGTLTAKDFLPQWREPARKFNAIDRFVWTGFVFVCVLAVVVKWFFN